MKILLAGPVPPHPGGGAIGRAELASGFAQAGHEVCVVAPITRDALREGDRLVADHPELRIVRYVLGHFEKLPFRPPDEEFVREERAQVVPLVSDQIERFVPDLVVVGRETFARYVPAVTKARGVASVLLVRGSPTGHILARRFPARDAEALLAEFRKVDHIITVARHLEEGLRSLGFDNVSHIENAIDTARFVRQPPSETLLRELGVDAGSIVVLVPANLHPRKRPADIVESAALALRRDPRLVYVFAGTGVLRGEIEQLCERLGVSRRVRFLGWVDYERMPALMNVADLVVMGSESEGLARVYLEAMACERLLLTSDIPAAREVVEDGVTGMLFRVADVEHLAARTVECAAADARLRETVGLRARARVQHMSVEQVVPRYLQVFTQVIASRTDAGATRL